MVKLVSESDLDKRTYPLLILQRAPIQRVPLEHRRRRVRLGVADGGPVGRRIANGVVVRLGIVPPQRRWTLRSFGDSQR